MAAGALEAAWHDVREFFSQRDAADRAARLDDTRREAIARDVRLAAQRRAAAEALAAAGHEAEALRAMRAAWALLAAGASAASAGTEASATAGLRDADDLPELDDDVVPAHRELFAHLRDDHARLHHALAPLGKPAGAHRKVAAERRFGAACVAIAATAAVAAFFARTRLSAEASASWSEKYPPSHAIDGDENTHWVLPDKELGWLDVKLAPARKLTTVSVLTGWSPATYGVVEYGLEAWAGGTVVKAASGTFPAPASGQKSSWVTVALPTDVKVDKVRLTAKSFHGIGGSIAEVKLP